MTFLQVFGNIFVVGFCLAYIGTFRWALRLGFDFVDAGFALILGILILVLGLLINTNLLDFS